MLPMVWTSLNLAFDDGITWDHTLRTDGVPVALLPPGHPSLGPAPAQAPGFPFRNFSRGFVGNALARGIDWRALGAVTPAKDQGAHGYCGTFGRVGAAEGQFALRAPKHLRRLHNFR